MCRCVLCCVTASYHIASGADELFVLVVVVPVYKAAIVCVTLGMCKQLGNETETTRKERTHLYLERERKEFGLIFRFVGLRKNI